MSERKGVIYGLYCVCENCEYARERVRYVGQTIVEKPSRRLDQHRFESRAEGAYLAVHLWMRKHGEYNLRMKILEDEVPEHLLDDRESHWIEKMETFKDAGAGGLNLTRDGKGSEITDKSRKNQKLALRKTYDQLREEALTKNHPGMTGDEVISAARERYKKDLEYGFKEMSEDLGIKNDHLMRRIIRNEEHFDPNYEPPAKNNRPSAYYRFKKGLLGERMHQRWVQAGQIREKWLEGGLTSKQMGELFGLDHTSIWHIVNNRTYTDPTYKNTRGRLVTESVRRDISRRLKGRPKPEGFGKRGSDNCGAILTESQVVEVLEKLHAGAKGIDVAQEYGVTPTTISCIKKGKTWVDVPRPEGFKS